MKSKSYLFLFFLGIILVFILGIRYGQNVEKSNKIVNYILSITPTQTPPTSVPLSFKQYSNKGCGIQFLIPSSFTVKTESSKSALFVENNKDMIQFNCEKTSLLFDMFKNPQTATGEVTFKNKKLAIKTINRSETYLIKIQNPITGMVVYAEIPNTLYPLFDSSLVFINR